MTNKKLFIKSIYKYQKLLGLLDWEIWVMPEKNKYSRARYHANSEGKICSVYYDKKVFIKKATKSEIRRTAFHEICELSLHDIRCYLETIYSHNFVDEYIHVQIRCMENLYFGNKNK